MKKRFVVIVCEREDWDNPTVSFVEANDEDHAIEVANELQGYDCDEDEEYLEELEEEGRIAYIVKEIENA